MQKRIGKQTLRYEMPPMILSAAAVAGDVENEGPLRGKFDRVMSDDTLGKSTFEQAESQMFEDAVNLALQKVDIPIDQLQCLLGGDLLNQLISANYAARQLNVPYLGMYSACSTMTQALLIGSMMVEGGFLENAICAASSHFSTAERQFRFPLEMGTTSTPTSQRTVTGAGAVLMARGNHAQDEGRICISGGTIGKVTDWGIKDMSNMGAAMAPAAANTILAHFQDMGRTAEDYDKIVTGDLGAFGTEMLREICMKEGTDLTGKHQDCGLIIYGEEKEMQCGGSGAGCSAIVFCAHLLELLRAGTWKRMLFLATGALMSPVSNKQGETIPAIAHAVVIERIG